MARTNLSSGAIHKLDRSVGTDITTLTGDTIVIGPDNGLIVLYRPGNVLVFNNGTVNPATVTLKTANPNTAGAVGLIVADKTVSVPNGETLIYPVSAIFRQADNVVYVDCDEAIDVAVLQL